MKIIQITDNHAKHDEPFLNSNKAFFSYIEDYLEKLKEDFILLHGGDVFHKSLDTGEVNRVILNFFNRVSVKSFCKQIIVIQGNHDIKTDTGSALEALKEVDKVLVVQTPQSVELGDGKYLYALPHMNPNSYPGYVDITSYSKPEFHEGKFDPENTFILSCHAGDETAGFFAHVNLSFLPATFRSHGDIHKRVSPNFLGSSLITRRDEKDKDCFLRVFDTKDSSMVEFPLPLFLNFVTIAYGEDLDEYWNKFPNRKPRESAIIDIEGHDDEDFVLAEYRKRYAGRTEPTLYFDRVIPEERRGEAVDSETSEGEDVSGVSIKEMFKDFTAEKNVNSRVISLLNTYI